MNADQRPPAAEPTPADRTVTDLVRVIARLSDELAQHRAEYAELRAGYFDLIAAGRATLSAARDGEPDALAYLADELIARHGQTDLAPPRWAVDQ